VARRFLQFHAWIAVALALTSIGVGLRWTARVAAGADAYGYVSQADLWRHGDLHIDQSFGAAVPWPMARWTFTPLGYRPAPDGHRIVPAYSPGLPLLMAAAKAIAGQCALFWVVPICGGVLIFATYAIGRRIGRPLVGLAAAWMVATSPAMLFMLMAPMSDVPAAAAWAVAVACLLAETPLSAGAAGLAAAIAILVRPNLAPLVGSLALWIGWRDVTAGRWRDWRRLATPWFVGPALAGAFTLAEVNARLYGSPMASGYDLTDAFAIAYVLPNLRRYVWWLVTAETPFALVGLLCLGVHSPRIWRTRESRSAQWLLGGCAAIVWIEYLLYVPWDAWWYLRFLLPSWPMMTIGTASLLAAVYRTSSAAWRLAPLGVLAAIGVVGIAQASQREAFSVARGEAKYVEVAKVVEAITGPDDVIISAQHSGSIRYYAGRLTLRWDVGDPAWLDRTVEWLAAHGHHPYFVLEDPEIERLRARFGPANAVARLDWAPMVVFRGGAVKIYDAIGRDRDAPPVAQPAARARHECVPQKPSPRLR
jgi:hypothetical protein